MEATTQQTWIQWDEFAMADRFDRIKKLTIIAMFSDDVLMDALVLKGGNALDLVYGVGHRASLDIDLSMGGDFAASDLAEIENRIREALEKTFAAEKFRVFDVRFAETPDNLTADMRPFWGGYRVQFKLMEEQRYRALAGDLNVLRRNATETGPAHARNVQIDISKHEYCRGKVPKDLDGYRIYVYTPEMLVIEKLRAICQQMPAYCKVVSHAPRPRPRDFVDIYYTMTHFPIDLTAVDNRKYLTAIFDAKRVPLYLLGEVHLVQQFHEQEFQAVRQTVRKAADLKEFSFYFSYVIGICCGLESLWKEETPGL